jgi:hypothetical protein
VLIICHIISTDEDPGLRIESFAVINLRGVSTNKTIIFYRHANIQRTYFFRIDIQLAYINTRGNWEYSKLCENTPPFGCRVSTQFLVFPISTRVDITVYQHGKCFIFVKYKIYYIEFCV